MRKNKDKAQATRHKVQGRSKVQDPKARKNQVWKTVNSIKKTALAIFDQDRNGLALSGVEGLPIAYCSRCPAYTILRTIKRWGEQANKLDHYIYI